MPTTDTIDLLKRLSTAVGVTGYSGPDSIYTVISEELQPAVDELDRDRIGSLIGFKAGEGESPRPKIMLAAHLDEIGAVVTKIDRGFLRFTQIGGLDPRVLMGQEVTVHGRRNLPGIIGSIPPHFQPQRTTRVDMSHMHVDVGLDADAVAAVVRIGDVISFRRTPAALLNDSLSAKSMDNRASVAAMILCLRHLRESLRHQWDVYAVATADEEWGSLVGATTQAYALRPDLALVLDVTFADVDQIEVKLDNGPVIGLGPGNHAGLRARLVDTCKTLEMKYQSEILPSSAGTDAEAIEISREGVPTVLISVPNRYMHTPIEVVHRKDVERTARLLAHFIAGLDETFLNTLTPTLNVATED